VRHLQAFSTSWRFAPPKAVQPYFMPKTSLGFDPLECFPFAKPATLLSALAPLDVTWAASIQKPKLREKQAFSKCLNTHQILIPNP
jgi:hypothetical protein